MTNYMESYLKYDLDTLKLNQIYESEYDKFNINIMEFNLNSTNDECISESSHIILEEATNNLVDKVVNFISSIIKTISDFIEETVLNISNLFRDKETQDTLNKLNDAVASDPDNPKFKKLVKIYKSVNERESLDEYIKDMAKLERKMMNLKVSYKLISSVKSGTYIIEYNNIIKEMDQLNEKYDKSIVNDDKDIIEMAMKDAIRFSDKELNNIKIDYNQIKKGSNEILAQFKKDANGCDIPIKLNIIQKMTNAISTRVRKIVNRIATYKHHNLKTILAIAATVGAVGFVLKNPQARGKATEVFNKGVKVLDDFSKKADAENEAIRKKLEKMK